MSDNEKQHSLYSIAGGKASLGGHQGGGNGGNMGGMDRLDALEKRVDAIDDRLGRIEGDVSSIKDSLRDLKVGIAEMSAKLNIGQIQATVEKAHTDIYKWLATLAIALISLGAAIYFGLQRSQQQVVYVPTPSTHQQPASPAPTTPPSSPRP